LDLAPRRITVNAVAPGWVDSALAEQTFEALAAHTGTLPGIIRQSAIAASPLGRLVAIEEVAQLVLFLASPAAAGITAQVYGVDTGQSLAV
ncbi:MAG: SDR family oxidoreductase, partial [Candidatus Sericytochromatia bacterium]|nr:SDR family oxidoreductase [Candidatus Sericytochromatia bacterium]